MQNQELSSSDAAVEATEASTSETAASFERYVLSLAEQHKLASKKQNLSKMSAFGQQLSSLQARVKAIYDKLAQAEQEISSGAQWLLDNDYVVQRAFRQIREDMPEHYYRQLPFLLEAEGQPRVYVLAGEVLRLSEGHFDAHLLKQFTLIYQRVSPLTTGELWAFPVLLRFTALEQLCQAGSQLMLENGRLEQANQQIAHAVLSLHELNKQVWTYFVKSVSLVDERLADDPAGFYLQLDDETSDGYRKVIEDLSRKTALPEEQVAQAALRLANTAKDSQATRYRHVGYYLVDKGRRKLEAELAYQAGFKDRWRRWLLSAAPKLYFMSIGVVWFGLLALLFRYLLVTERTWLLGGLLVLLAFIPAAVLASQLINWLVTQFVAPRTLPKLDFSKGIPEAYRSLVVMPILLSTKEAINGHLAQLERHYTANPDPSLRFALISDYVDAPEEHMPEDDELLEQLNHGIAALNTKYGAQRFWFFQRERRWNQLEACWMGWERKRGKLSELNKLLISENTGSFAEISVAHNELKGFKFVITLDADTTLPPGTAQRLVATLAHPLNQAEFDKTNKIIAGYSILQPRLEVHPLSANKSRFSQIFAGDQGLDLYTRAVSDVYQDLFAEGTYAGKGIYDLAAFERSQAGCIPENAILSHDLFEGSLGRTALLSDAMLLEVYPARYLAYAYRLHRWVRGDWQLLPWLSWRVPSTAGKTRNPLNHLARWKIFDNLLRSLFLPSLFACLLFAWFVLAANPIVLTLGVIFTLALPSVLACLNGVFQGIHVASWASGFCGLANVLWRGLLAIVFLPYEAGLSLSAVATTLLRLGFSHKHFLQWQTADSTAQLFAKQKGALRVWLQMLFAPTVALAVAGSLVILGKPVIWLALPFLIAWFVSPQLAYWLSKPHQAEVLALSSTDKQQLRTLARRTWLYFERFVGPEDHWLAPDHFQEKPRGTVAHRTSPTNIGLALTASLSAYDLGYLSAYELALRLRGTFDSLKQLERYRGHFLNWYDTQSFEPLPPRYVSTVDSGNFLGCLLALKQGCLSLSSEPVCSWQRWQGLLDTLEVLAETLEGTKLESDILPLQHKLTFIKEKITTLRVIPADWFSSLDGLVEQEFAELDAQLLQLIEHLTPKLSVDALTDLSIWTGRLHQHLKSMQREAKLYLPWCGALISVPDEVKSSDLWPALERLPALPKFKELPVIYQTVQALIQKQTFTNSEARAWVDQLVINIAEAEQAVNDLNKEASSLSQEAEELIADTDMTFLFDTERDVFRIGYHLEANRLDDHAYDLLASEARIASLVAIAKGDVPADHWLHLGRPLSKWGGKRVLLSWSGTMFEYLMPMLLLKTPTDSLLYQSCSAAVERQMTYAEHKNVPWGISESGFFHTDAQENYQYRAFGAPGLGFARESSSELVISPYASLLALPLKPQAVLQNVAKLRELGMMGRYGLYEAIDYSKTRLSLGQHAAIVRSFMVHHQGMAFVSLSNTLTSDKMVTRFHTDPRIQSTEMLLYEPTSLSAPLETSLALEPSSLKQTKLKHSYTSWLVPKDTPFPQLHCLANEHYSVLMTSSGGGLSRWNDLELSRWQADSTLDDWGQWLYVQDLESGKLLSACRQPCHVPVEEEQVRFYPHKLEFHRRTNDLSLDLEVAVSPSDDVEIRLLTLSNHSHKAKRLALTSYAETVLAPHEADLRHPAFSKLFIESSFDSETGALMFQRRPRDPNEKQVILAHRLVFEKDQGAPLSYETDRASFVGRNGTLALPEALTEGKQGLTGSLGATLDPIMALGTTVTVEAHSNLRLAYLTMAADARPKVLALARRYSAWSAVEAACSQAKANSERSLDQLELSSAELETFQRLLSALIYPQGQLRASSDMLALNTKSQSALWAHGISGDHPILLLRIRSEKDTDLLRILLKAHRYWRERQLKIDLVVLNERDIGYLQDLQGLLRRLLTQKGDDLWLDRPGGIFLLRSDQISQEDRRLLHTAARSVLSADAGTLEQQLARALEPVPQLPAFNPARLTATFEQLETPVVARPSDLRFDNGLGGFSADGCEYLVYLNDRSTPAPWINVLTNPTFGCLVSESGGSYSWAGNSGEYRLTPWHNDPVTDRSGEALYLRDEASAAVWSPTPEPAKANGPYLLRHGAGYSHFEHNSHGLKQDTQIFVDKANPVKIIKLKLQNLWEQPRRLTLTYYAEWVLGPQREKMQAFIIPSYHAEHAALLAKNPYSAEFGEGVAFLASSKDPHGLTTDRSEFLGREGSLQRPAALTRIGLSGRVVTGNDPCAALQMHIDLPALAKDEVYFLLGWGENEQAALKTIANYRDPARVEQAWQALNTHWDKLLNTVQITTPDPAMNLLTNRWLLYQSLTSRFWGRSAFYQSSGAYGFRDQLQDSMAFVHTAPELTKEQLLRAAQHQFQEGDVLHWWHPPSGRGVRTRISDDLVWLPYVLAHYLEATADDSILAEELSFLKGNALEPNEHERYDQFQTSVATASLYDHACRALDKALTQGDHDLPLIGGGDWNDGMNRVGVQGQGESVWLAWFLISSLKRFIPICVKQNDHKRVERYQAEQERLRQALEEHAWDGNWYLRAFYDDGTPLGSSQNKEASIDAISQSWAVLSGVAEPKRAQQAMTSLAKHLLREEDALILLLSPPFDKTPQDPGYIKGYVPGVRENGGQYTHAALWTVWAFAELGQGDRAEALFKLLNPIYHSHSPETTERYKVEPYVIAADVYGVPPHVGRGGWTWYTGAASWMYRLALEGILGLKRKGDTLELNPCIPCSWQEFDIHYRFGGCCYYLHVDNQAGVNQGVKEVLLDGVALPSKLIPLSQDSQSHEVQIVMG